MLDSSAVIALLDDLDRPDLIDSLLKLGHVLAIPGRVMEGELLRAKVRKRVDELARQGKVTILKGSTPEDFRAFQSIARGLGLGESDAMIVCKKAQRQGKVYCILDDGRARSRAAKNGVPFTGVLGLLRLLKDRGIVEGSEIDEIVAELRRSSFRVPASVDM